MPEEDRSNALEYPGAYYHVMARGNRREAIFRDETHRQFFLALRLLGAGESSALAFMA